MERAGPSKRSVPAVSLALLPMTRCRSLHRRVCWSFWRGRFGCVTAPAVAMPESDLEVTAMLSRATERVGLEWRKPPCPEPSRLTTLGVACAGSQRPALGASLPDVHEGLTGSGRHLLLPETDLLTPSPSPPLVVQLEVTGVPPVERSVAMQMCPYTVSTRQGKPCLLFRACRYSSGRRGLCGLWRCCLHLMLRRYCRFFRLKALREMHGGGYDPEVLKELRTAPDLAPRATKVMARSLGRAMSTLVVQELWLCLVDIGTPTKFGSSRFLYPRLASSATQPVTWPSSSRLHRSRRTLPASASDRQRDARAVSLRSPSLPHRGYVGGFVGVTSTVLGGLASAPQPVSLAPPYHQTRLCDSVRPATSQVSRHPLHRSEDSGCPHLASIAVLLAKDAIEPVPPADMRSGFYSPYFIVPKKGGGLRPILDLRVLNRALHRLPFKMLTPKRIFGCVRPQDWFAAIDLKDAYFHVSILQRHRPFLRFAFEGRAYQYKVLPLGQSLSPRVFTKVAEAALVPMREQGVRILNYLEDWLILAQSRDQLCEHRDLVLSHLSQLGLQVNWEKSKLSTVQRISFLGMELDSVSQTARLMQERAQSVLNCLNTFKNRTAAPLKQFQRLLGHMAAAAVVTPLGLLHMRPLQHWLRGRVPRWAWQSGTLRVQVTPACRQTFTPWSDLHSFGQECPWNRSPGTLWFTQMPPPRAEGPCSTGMQCQGFGRVPNCTGTSTA